MAQEVRYCNRLSWLAGCVHVCVCGSGGKFIAEKHDGSVLLEASIQVIPASLSTLLISKFECLSQPLRP